MPNLKGNESSLVKYKPKWQSGKTRTIRVPLAIANLVLEAAKEIDENGNVSLLQVINDLKKENEQLKKKSNLFTRDSENNRKVFILDGKKAEICTTNINADNVCEFKIVSDRQIAEEIKCDRSTIGKIRRRILKGQVFKSRYLDRLTDYQAVSKGWLKKTDTSD